MDELQLDSEVVQSLKEQNKIEELYRYVLIKQCNALNPIFPELFDKQESYLEYLLPNNLLGQDSVIRKIRIIPDEDFLNDVEVVGWLYQFYNSVKKDEVFASKETITKDTLPAVTQLFTPDWIVRYMADNSVGRLWLESYPNSSLKNDLKYYVEDAEQEDDVKRKIEEIKYKNVNPEEIRVIEPCCGSGHILVYVFDLLYKIYLEKGYNSKDIPSLILKNNLYGLDVDKRAAQLAQFSLIMKARSIDSRFFTKERFVYPNVYDFKDSQFLIMCNFETSMVNLNFSKESINLAKYLVETFRNARVIGSLLKVEKKDYALLKEDIDRCLSNEYPGLFEQEFYHIGLSQLLQLIRLAELLSSQYDVMITNPPYIGISSFDSETKAYANKYYKDSKTDMFAMFMQTTFVKFNGFLSMINMHSWMFLISYSNLRLELLNSQTLINMIHLGSRAFETIGGEVVQTVSFVFRKCSCKKYNSSVYRLLKYDANEKNNAVLEKKEQPYYFCFDKVLLMPNTPFAYWINENTISAFLNSKLSEIGDCKTGMTTGDNEKFLRHWYEIDATQINHNYRFYNKGGGYRKWYGNIDFVINWSNNGYDVKSFNGSTIRNENYYFRPCISWNLITTDVISTRFLENNFVMGDAGPAFYDRANNIDNLYFTLALLNSNVSDYLLKIINPTINYSCGVMDSFPYICGNREEVIKLSKECCEILKNEWDSHEISFEFKKHPLVSRNVLLSDQFDKLQSKRLDDIENLKQNEKLINEIFINLYNLGNELTSDVPDYLISLQKLDRSQTIKELISYLIGIKMGRYCLEENGLYFAGHNASDIILKDYIDDDGILPIYKFVGIESGLTTEICSLVRKIFGDTYYSENLSYIADSLGRKPEEDPQETINRYLNDEFYNDHLKLYQKRPIYWLMSSGKNGAFKCLVYIHRYSKNTLALVNSKYFLPRTALYKTERERLEFQRKAVNDQKQIKLLDKSISEIERCEEELLEFGQILDHMANKYIALSLNDGVKHNYCLFKNISLEVNGATIKKSLFFDFGLEEKKKGEK